MGISWNPYIPSFYQVFLQSPERLSTGEMEDELHLPLLVGQNKTKLRTIKNLNKEVNLRNRILAVLV